MKIKGEEASKRLRDCCGLAPVIPVLTIDSLSDAVPMGEALVEGGLPVLEVTLRTPVALQAISEMASISGAVVGAGTLLTPNDVSRAKDAGANFGVSPGTTGELIDACEAAGLPLLGGASSASEAMSLLARGYTMQKFFPAESSGGTKALAALASPLPQISFCPTGGISETSAVDYLTLPNVTCVGGSWVTPKSLIADKAWGEISELARKASKLGQPG